MPGFSDAYQLDAFQGDAFQPVGTFNTWPDVAVKIAFANDALDESVTWTDISADVMDIDINRGRTYEMNRIEAGTATVTLKNTEGNYWPNNTTGAYYPNVKPIKYIAIGATWAGTTYYIFCGYIEKYIPNWLLPGMKVPTMTLQCADLQKNLSRYLINGSGYPSELSGARINRVLNDWGWSSTERTVTTGESTLMAASTMSNVNAMNHIYSVLDSEPGIFFIAKDGKPTYEGRYTRSTATSAASFTDDGTDYVIPSISYDDMYIYNEVRRQRTGGTEMVAKDVDSASTYGLRTNQVGGLLNETDDEVCDAAYFYLNKWKDPHLRVDSLTIIPSADSATLYPIVLGYDISKKITLAVTPASINQDYFIEGIKHTWRATEPEMWQTIWQLSNASESHFPERAYMTLAPNAAGDLAGLTPYGTTDNYACAITAGDSKFVYTVLASQMDLYNLGSTGGGNNPVEKVVVNSLWLKYSGDTAHVTTQIKYDGNIYTGTSHAVDFGPAVLTDTFYPTGKTLTDIDSLQAGPYIIQNDSALNIKCDSLSVDVHYYTNWS